MVYGVHLSTLLHHGTMRYRMNNYYLKQLNNARCVDRFHSNHVHCAISNIGFFPSGRMNFTIKIIYTYTMIIPMSAIYTVRAQYYNIYLCYFQRPNGIFNIQHGQKLNSKVSKQ